MPNILIVCTANICRSPMAVALLQRRLQRKKPAGEWRVASAGTWARDGHHASELGVELMATVGLDTSRHRSRVVTSDLLEAADLVLTMEAGHKEAMRVEFPRAASKIYMLSEMVKGEIDVDDPFGGTMDEYKECAKEINRYIVQGYERILALALANSPS